MRHVNRLLVLTAAGEKEMQAIAAVIVAAVLSGCLASQGSMVGYGGSEEGDFRADEVRVFLHWDYTWIREDGRPRITPFTPDSLILTDSIWGREIESIEGALANRINEVRNSATRVLMVHLIDGTLLLVARGRALQALSREHIRNVFFGWEAAEPI